jgi:hypothetical protein
MSLFSAGVAILLTFPNRGNCDLWSHGRNLDGLVTIQERLRWALISDNRVNRIQWTNREGRRSVKLLLSGQPDHFCRRLDHLLLDGQFICLDGAHSEF